ncbi:MAG: redox-sensing transcriptional repressor Rex [Spirochaetes bacterium]|jgi:redox-sensing transcriptional repressor|nr:redox-sensing transcriptional repressor Rex [Spirochaetota bacterium]
MINRKRIIRLIRYKNVLKKLRNSGEDKVFSNILAELTGEKSTQVRKDFSLLKITGNKKSGYDIHELIERVNEILIKREKNCAIIVGCGKMAKALMEYQNFEDENITISAGFDNNPKKISRAKATPIYPVEEIESYVKEHSIKVAILTVPAKSAQPVFEQLKDCGIRAVMNFAPVTLKNCDEVTVKYINLDVELESLFYFVNAR